MLMSVHNTTSRILNRLSAITFTSPFPTCSLNAVSDGQREDPLPYPFRHVTIGVHGGGSDTKQLPVHAADMYHKDIPSLPMFPWNEWNMLVQAGTVEITMADETGGLRDVNDDLINEI